jgi:hypothetical protein
MDGISEYEDGNKPRLKRKLQAQNIERGCVYMITVRDDEGRKCYEGLDYRLTEYGAIEVLKEAVRTITYTPDPQKPNRAQRRHPRKAII